MQETGYGPGHGSSGANGREPLQRFKLAVQRNRIIFYTFAVGIALIFKLIGVFHIGYSVIIGIWAVAVASAYALRAVYAKWWRLALDPVWFVLDAALVTFAVYATGGANSPWFPWYVASMGGAAVAGGFEWAIIMALLDLTAYMSILMAMGQVHFFDAGFFHYLTVAISLFCAPAFFLWGTVDLQKKRVLIKQLKENESRKVAELTRLTEALDQRTRDLTEANLQVRQADRLKSQFLANMSHELRTPLTSIIGFSEVLEQRLEGRLGERDIGFLEHIHTSGEHLLGVINDILDLSKIEADKMELVPEPVRLAEIVAGVATVMKGITDKRRIVVKADIPSDLPEVSADPVRVKQILYNLLSNAVKFSPDGSAVRVTARALGPAETPFGNEGVSLFVADQGVGIDPRFHGVVFEEFRQVDDSSSRPYGGTGLGLALVKRFVELHGGAVSLESAPGKGSTFTVILPVDFAGQDAGASSRAIGELVGHGTRILVVEDDPTAYELIARALTRAALVPIRARTGAEALKLALDAKPSAVTLDLILPDMDGFKVLQQLKEGAETRALPVVIVSMLDNKDLGLALGADDYFLKPIESAALVQRLMQLLPGGGPQPARLLVVDDDPKFHDLLEAMLAPRGWILDHALTGAEGVAKAAKAPYDLVILDLMMEGMDGFEAATRLRAAPGGESVPILVLTAKELNLSDHQKLLGKVTAVARKGTATPAALVEMIQGALKRNTRRT